MKHFTSQGILSTSILKTALLIGQSISHTMVTKSKYTHDQDSCQ